MHLRAPRILRERTAHADDGVEQRRGHGEDGFLKILRLRPEAQRHGVAVERPNKNLASLAGQPLSTFADCLLAEVPGRAVIGKGLGGAVGIAMGLRLMSRGH